MTPIEVKKEFIKVETMFADIYACEGYGPDAMREAYNAHVDELKGNLERLVMMYQLLEGRWWNHHRKNAVMNETYDELLRHNDMLADETLKISQLNEYHTRSNS